MVGVIIALLRIYQLAILIQVVVSWIAVDRTHPLFHFIESITEPVLAPIRRFAVLGGLDLSPLVVLLLLQLIISLIR